MKSETPVAHDAPSGQETESRFFQFLSGSGMAGALALAVCILGLSVRGCSSLSPADRFEDFGGFLFYVAFVQPVILIMGGLFALMRKRERSSTLVSTLSALFAVALSGMSLLILLLG